MKISKPFGSLFILFFSGLCLYGSFLVSKKSEMPSIKISKQDSTFNFNSESWKYFNLGQKRLISSLLWVATIMESDIDRYPSRDLNSWMFLRFKTISELEPLFYENYSYGGPYLSIIKDDLIGASYLYDRGLIFYPNSAHLLLNAGFHYEFEVKDSEKAYPLLKRLSKIEKTTMLTTTLAKLEARNGDLSDAFIIMNELQNSFSKDTIFWEKIYNYRYAIKAEIDLKCLNENKVGCETRDLDGNKYIVMNGSFKAQKEWVKFK